MYGRWGWFTQKEQAGALAFLGGACALFGIFGGDPLLDKLAFLLLGAGLLVGFGATYCLLDDPEGEDVFLLKTAARLGFLLVGPGVGVFLWQDGEKAALWIPCILTAIPLFSLVRLLLRHRRDNREKDPWEE